MKGKAQGPRPLQLPGAGVQVIQLACSLLGFYFLVSLHFRSEPSLSLDFSLRKQTSRMQRLGGPLGTGTLSRGLSPRQLIARAIESSARRRAIQS